MSKDANEGQQSLNSSGTITSFHSHIPHSEWIVDSGATHHASLESLTRHEEVRQFRNDKVYLPTGDRADITHIGDAQVFEESIMQNVLYVPDLRFNLMSVSRIT